MNAANKGVPYVTEQPRSAYARVLAALAGAPPRPARLGWLRRRLAPRPRGVAIMPSAQAVP